LFTHSEENINFHYDEIYSIFRGTLSKELNDYTRNKIEESLNQKKVKAIYSIFEIGINHFFSESEQLKLVKNALEICVSSQKLNFSYPLQTLIEKISKNKQNL
jgi:hypothetical protein